jgi:hypothetical protein
MNEILVQFVNVNHVCKKRSFLSDADFPADDGSILSTASGGKWQVVVQLEGWCVRPSLVKRRHTRRLAWESGQRITVEKREGKERTRWHRMCWGTIQVRVVCRCVELS